MKNIVSDACAPLYVLAKTISRYEEDQKAIKREYEEMIRRANHSVGELEKAYLDEVKVKPAGAYRVLFGGGSLPVYFDGKDTLIAFSESREKTETKIALRTTDELREMLELPKATKADVLFEAIVEKFPLAQSLLGLNVVESPVIATARSKSAPTVDQAFEELTHPIIKRKITDILQIQNEFSQDNNQQRYISNKKIISSLKEIQVFLKQVLINKKDQMPENPYITISSTKKLSVDEQKMSKISIDDLPVSSLLMVKDMSAEQGKSLTVKWVGSIAQMDANRLDSDLIGLLSRNSTQTSRMNAHQVLFSEPEQPDAFLRPYIH
jgi:hypothetical protein